MNRTCLSLILGTIPYDEAVSLQNRLVLARAEGVIPEVILSLEHPSVFTLGRFRGRCDVLVPEERLLAEGIAVYESDRGGGTTYHGPGQLVVYPILNLRSLGLGVVQYVRNLEEVVIRALDTFGIRGQRVSGYPGVWVDGEKVCSIGLHISRGITKHGLALNVNTDLRYFDYIVPCGLPQVRMTSLATLLGCEVAMEEVRERVLWACSQIFPLAIEASSLPSRGDRISAKLTNLADESADERVLTYAGKPPISLNERHL